MPTTTSTTPMRKMNAWLSGILQGSHPEHRPWTCEENEQRNKFEDTSQWAARCFLASLHAKVRAQIEEVLVEALHRRCTGCGVPTERIDACCHMTCAHCRAEFSWICGSEYRHCRANHPCLNGSIYLHTMPQLVDILNARGLECTDQNGSDLFLAPSVDHMPPCRCPCIWTSAPTSTVYIIIYFLLYNVC